jgi:hypothetical protein
MKFRHATPAVVLLAFFVLAARAEYWPSGCGYGCKPAPCAPDACGPGYYCTGPCGMVYGPNYCLYPGGQPFNGLLPPPAPGGPGGPGGPGFPGGFGANPAGYPPGQGPLNSPLFPTHPYARSPRDFFMIDLY